MTAPEICATPRWEWRTFGPTLASLEAKIGAVADVAPHESEEIYLLNFAGPDNAKIRDGVLDIKQLQQVDSSGLELWKPMFKAAFPLSAALLQSALSVWRVPAPFRFEREAYTLEQFLSELVAPHGALRPVRVDKTRRAFSFAGCSAEFVRVHIDGLVQESFCIEDEEPARVIAALRELGLNSHANVNFPAGLKRALVPSLETPAASA